jgi:hypothetical protein
LFALNSSTLPEHEKNCAKEKQHNHKRRCTCFGNPNEKQNKSETKLLLFRPTYHYELKKKHRKQMTDEENKNDVICFANPVPSAFLPTGKFGKDFRSILDDNKSTNGRWHVAISNEKHPIPI